MPVMSSMTGNRLRSGSRGSTLSPAFLSATAGAALAPCNAGIKLPPTAAATPSAKNPAAAKGSKTKAGGASLNIPLPRSPPRILMTPTASPRPRASPIVAPITPAMPPSMVTSATIPLRWSPNVRSKAKLCSRRATESDCVEYTRKLPVNNATSANMERLTRYARESASLCCASSFSSLMIVPAGVSDANRARTTLAWASGSNFTSIRSILPSRPNTYCAAAISTTPTRRPSAMPGSKPRTTMSCALPLAFILTVSPTRRSPAVSASLERNSALLSNMSSPLPVLAGAPIRLGVTVAARSTSSPSRLKG